MLNHHHDGTRHCGGSEDAVFLPRRKRQRIGAGSQILRRQQKTIFSVIVFLVPKGPFVGKMGNCQTLGVGVRVVSARTNRREFSGGMERLRGIELHFLGALNFQVSEPEIWQRSLFFLRISWIFLEISAPEKFSWTLNQKNPRVRKNVCPQFWRRKWLRQFYGRLEKLRSFCSKTSMPIKFLVFGGWYFGSFAGGGRGKCRLYYLYIYGREDFSDWKMAIPYATNPYPHQVPAETKR